MPAAHPPEFVVVETRDFIQTTLTGDLDLEATRRMLLRLAHENTEAEYDLLIDVRQAESQGLSYSDIYELVRELGRHADSFRTKIAVVDTFRPGFEKAQFFESSATDKGFRVRAFVEYEEALRWLHPSRPIVR